MTDESKDRYAFPYITFQIDLGSFGVVNFLAAATLMSFKWLSERGFWLKVLPTAVASNALRLWPSSKPLSLLLMPLVRPLVMALPPEIIVQKEERTERYKLLLSRRIHGNLKLSAINSDFVHGDDYQSLANAAAVLSGKVLPGSKVRRGDPDKNQKEQSIQDFRAAFAWLLSEAERVLSRQRYKGLGEMNPSQLWETTMDAGSRTLLQVKIEDAIAADQVFTTLMGDEVEPRRAFIEKNALIARNLDV
jgi:DNA gyrase subunit B